MLRAVFFNVFYDGKLLNISLYWTGGCGEAYCDDDSFFAQGRAIGRDIPESEGSLMASYSVYVVDPGAAPRNLLNVLFKKKEIKD